MAKWDRGNWVGWERRTRPTEGRTEFPEHSLEPALCHCAEGHEVTKPFPQVRSSSSVSGSQRVTQRSACIRSVNYAMWMVGLSARGCWVNVSRLDGMGGKVENSNLRATGEQHEETNLMRPCAMSL